MRRRSPHLPSLETLLVEATTRAVAAAQRCRNSGVQGKDADRLVSQVMSGFMRDRTGFALICEEDTPSHARFHGERHAFLIDPIDGTDGFDRGDPEFAHMAAFLEDGQPVAAAIACPGYGWLLSGNMHTGQVWLRDLDANGEVGSRRRPPPRAEADALCAVIAQSELTESILGRLHPLGVERLILADSAVAFCHLLMGNAGLFLRTLPCRDWDIAAGHALVRIQHGEMTDLNGAPIVYGRGDLAHAGFIAYAARPRSRGAADD
jgi:3'(2'), 5'-bisphosphate nucleotidase